MLVSSLRSFSMDAIPILFINRHRINLDGHGVITLVAFTGCHLNRKYCINDDCHSTNLKSLMYTPQELYEEVKIDDIYFRATQGGITFGGGEPGLQVEFITEFRSLCGSKWKLNIETSLNYPTEILIRLLNVVDSFIIDIKDLNPSIYLSYTGQSNKFLLENLEFLSKNNLCDRCLIRVPHISDFNNKLDVAKSVTRIRLLGFNKIDIFNYRIL